MDQATPETIERRSGVALWRQIADRIRQLAATGELDGSGRLPPETALAERFGVNRHTVRSAIALLAQEGVLRTEQGRGTFIEARRRLRYPIGRRTRFSAGLAGQAEERRSILVSASTGPASAEVAAALDLPPGAPVVRLEMRSEADGRPLSRTVSWFDGGRLEGIDSQFASTGSVTSSLKALGIEDYVRRSTAITAGLADREDLEILRLSPGAVVLVTEAVNTDMAGRPIEFSRTRFAADRVELRIDQPEAPARDPDGKRGA